MMENFIFPFCTLLTTLLHLCNGAAHFTSSAPQLNDIEFVAGPDHEFDLLIFTQQWPVTTCLEWMEWNKNHKCALPSPKEIWTIHGVWPTKYGTIGPAFCDPNAAFNLDELKPLQEQLEQFWMNIEKGQQLWQHEWLKHGTCAQVLPELNNENKYFGQGLSWLQQYSMSAILAMGNILPDSEHTVVNIHQAVVAGLNTNPFIRCIKDKNQSFLSEIRICFNKTLSLVNCDGVAGVGQVTVDGVGKINTNCDASSVILYPSVVPAARINKSKSEWQFPYVNVYKLLEMIKWLTL